MARHRYVIAYDIADPARLRRVCTLMEDHGERLQYSVFLCDLSPAERAELESRATDVIDLAHDSIIHIDLGPIPSAPPIHTLGKPRTLPNPRAKIV
ncbi:CRISPR-associated protein Cas2 [Amycolatopsis sulphurea]|uniref:CRISPR-associated endoribonuclease Cas2 n=1 Tax=Amycolatopsis sulphurea TaxID=76022 RepID=A0A2A9FIB3_9PSEU|nr:CRISPR-associated endonuclease Cas2 [Amycolatopsis sulphurea]PFG50169.1 CRISPR-associated protein Cas2 [Amycolatopsis sulphurea]